MEAAFKVLTERGYHGISIAEIAQQAGIGQSTVCRYGSSKRELLDQVFDSAVERAFTTVDPYALLPADPASAQDMVTQIGVQAGAIDRELTTRVVGREALINSLAGQSPTRTIDRGRLELTDELKPIIARMLTMLSPLRRASRMPGSMP